MRLVQIITVLIFSLFCLGCGEEATKEKTESETFTDSLAGSWNSGCTTEETDEGIEGTTELYVFGSGTLNLTNNIGGSEVCENFGLRMNAALTFATGDDVPTVTGAKNLDLTVVKFELTPLSAEFLGFMNDGSLCESNDWEINATKDVTGKTCNFGGDNPLPTAVGDVMRDIIKLADDGASFQLGESGEDDEYDGTTDAKRPVALDAGTTYTKE